jgi:hypothetical protein
MCHRNYGVRLSGYDRTTGFLVSNLQCPYHLVLSKESLSVLEPGVISHVIVFGSTVWIISGMRRIPSVTN